MILGIGNDIIEIARIGKSIQRFGDVFLERLFTSSEITYCGAFCDRERHFAGRFAAKEAIAKALGCGIGKRLGWLEIEVDSAEGPPQVKLSPAVAKSFGNPIIHLSISHCHNYATAVAIVLSGTL